MIADVSKEISKKYGCLIEDGDDAGVAFRATYIIDDKVLVLPNFAMDKAQP